MRSKLGLYIIAVIIFVGGLFFLSTIYRRNYVIVEDFEKYDNEKEADTVFGNWSDGFDSNDNGANIGHSIIPFMESYIVHGGAQSAPIYYDLKNNNFAEATVKTNNLPIGNDWTKSLSDTLTLWFYGERENIPALMYVKLNDSKIYYAGKAEDLKKTKWIRWDIEFSKINTDFKNISTLSIGFDKSNEYPDGQGIIFFDDIRLYKNMKEN